MVQLGAISSSAHSSMQVYDAHPFIVSQNLGLLHSQKLPPISVVIYQTVSCSCLRTFFKHYTISGFLIVVVSVQKYSSYKLFYS